MTGDSLPLVKHSRNRTASADVATTPITSPSKFRAHGSFFTKNLGPEYMKLQSILSKYAPANRNQEQLHAITKYLETTMIKREAWWTFMGEDLRKKVCKNVKYRQVVDNMGHQFSLSRSSGSVFYVLLRGEASVSYQNMATQVCKSGDCFGSLHIPANVKKLAKEHAAANKIVPTFCSAMLDAAEGKGKYGNKNNNKQKVNKGRVQVHIKKGSEYVIIQSSDCLPFLKKWSETLKVETILKEVGLIAMKNRIVTKKPVSFPAGVTIVKEGDKPTFVYAIIEGECKLTKSFDSKSSVIKGAVENGMGPETGITPESMAGGFGTGMAPVVVNEKGEANNNNGGAARRKVGGRLVLQSGFVAKVNGKGLAKLGIRSLVGDIPVLLGGVQPASVVTSTSVKALKFNASDLEDKLGNYHDLKKAFANMCKLRSAFIEQRWKISTGNATQAEAVDLTEMMEAQTQIIKKTWKHERLNTLRIVREMERRIAEEEEWSDEDGYSDDDDSSMMEEDTMTVGSRSTRFTQGSRIRGGRSSPFKVKKKMMSKREQYAASRREIEAENFEEWEEGSPGKDKGIWVDKEKNKAIIERPKVDLGPPEITFEMVFQQRVKKKPLTNRHKLLDDFKRRLLDEEKDDGPILYEEPLDPFERFDFIDTSGYALNTASALDWAAKKEGDWKDKFGDHDMLSPFPTITKERKLHGKAMPVVEHSDGFKDPFRTLIPPSRGYSSQGGRVKARDRVEIDRALEAGFKAGVFPKFKEMGGEEVSVRPMTTNSVIGSIGSLGMRTSLFEGGMSMSLGKSTWSLQEEAEGRKYLGGGGKTEFVDVVQREGGKGASAKITDIGRMGFAHGVKVKKGFGRLGGAKSLQKLATKVDHRPLF
ncbi:hypothetical protein TrLO_g14051 [Triparma laevis f. longispina]|uniref:Cyclic nucleotide-binding domain-containing protein n=1 Tax=Triparma laevis f. longispina TaxID=1714387 RepID=A0A9W7KY44_9STRA|nr:hypothetical protein TrLO_g14051 [Triparma laevis f. longispina]